MSDYYPPAAVVTADMQVIDAAGALVGHVKALRGPYVLVDRRLKRDLYVPLEAIVARDDDILALNVTIDQFDDLGWGNPPLLGGQEPDPLLAPDHEVVNRDVLAVGDATERDTPLDSRPGQLPTSGTDDGALPPAGDFLTADQQRLRDLSG
jgi:uncharacterized protein DUF2171